jgi:hypothetical protein
MKRVLVLALAVLALTQVPAFSMTNAEPDGNRHPAVGVLFFQRVYSPGVLGPHAACSGSLISSTVFLTAAHCIDVFNDPQVVNVGVHFETTYDPFNPPKLIPVTSWASDPRWDGKSGGTAPDIGVVILAKAQNTVPATLPTLGLLDQMRKEGTIDDEPFDGVGYGCVPTLTGSPDCPYDGVRRFGLFAFKTLNKESLEVSNKDTSSACHGDSGSPKFLSDTTTIVGITSWGDTNCRATDWNSRVDTKGARAFLGRFVSLP